MQKNCNAAMMLKDACFTVTCHKDELCEKKPIPTSSSYNPKIAFVYRDKKQKKKGESKVSYKYYYYFVYNYYYAFHT